MNDIVKVGSVLFGADEFVARFVQARLNMVRPFERYAGLGVVKRGVFLGGVIYHNFCEFKDGNMIDVSFAFDSPSWATPETLKTICRYPFNQLGCVRVTALAAKSNKRSRQMIEFVGFTREGAHKFGWEGRETAISYGITRDTCRWVKDEINGQEHSQPAAAA